MTFLQTPTYRKLLIQHIYARAMGGGVPLPARQHTLLVYATRQESTVHHKDLARDKSRSIASQKNSRPHKLLGLPEPPHRGPHQKLLTAVALIQQLLVQRRPEDSRRNRIHRHALRTPLHRQRLRQRTN